MDVFVGSGVKTCSGMDEDGWCLVGLLTLHLAEPATGKGWKMAGEKRDEGRLVGARLSI